MKNLPLKTFIQLSTIDEKLIKAVVKQSGGYDEFKEHALNLQNTGADGGFYGFVYYNETIAFTKKNRKEIMRLITILADDIGQGSVEMIAKFNCFKRDKLNANDIL